MGNKFPSQGTDTDHMVHEEGVTLEAGAVARVATGIGAATEWEVMPDCTGVMAVFETISTAAGGLDFGALVGDTFDIVVQTLIAGQWIDVVAFTQILGNDADKDQVHVAKIMSQTAEAMFEDAVLAAGNVRHLLGSQWRARWTLGAAGTMTFTVMIQPIK